MEREELEAIAYRLAGRYGEEMRLHGMSLEWESPRECPDTTSELRRDPDFELLPDDMKTTILNYGNLMKRFGLGCYQEHTAAAELYDRYGGTPPANPFAKKRDSYSRGSSGSQPGE